jgi:hypothetical protein
VRPPGTPDGYFTQPSAPRVYDVLLGGKDNFAPDREKAEELMRAHPGLRSLARANRRFVLAATTWAASEGIGQFLDLGCGLPASPMVHAAARDVDPSARVVYADQDLVVMSHMQAEVHGRTGLAAVTADVSDPASVLGDEGLLGVIDFAEPVCVILGGTLSAMDAETARAAVKGYAGALAPGSVVAISCASYADPAFGERMAILFGCGGWRNHSREDVRSFFEAGGLRPARGEVADVGSWPMLPSGCRKDAMVIGGIGLVDR